MRTLFLAIQQYLLSALTAQRVNYIRMWNNQLDDLLGGQISDFALKDDVGYTPAILIEFASPMTINQLGNGDQIYDDLIIRVHILHEFYDAQDGTEAQDLDVLSIAQSVFFAFQDWMPNIMTINGIDYQIPVGVMVRCSETQDYNHPDVYHFVQEYKTNWVDSMRNRPVAGKLSVPPLNYELAVIKGVPNTESNSNYYLN